MISYTLNYVCELFGVKTWLCAYLWTLILYIFLCHVVVSSYPTFYELPSPYPSPVSVSMLLKSLQMKDAMLHDSNICKMLTWEMMTKLTWMKSAPKANLSLLMPRTACIENSYPGLVNPYYYCITLFCFPDYPDILSSHWMILSGCSRPNLQAFHFSFFFFNFFPLVLIALWALPSGPP